MGISQIVKVEARRGSFLQVRHGPVFKEIGGFRKFRDLGRSRLEIWLNWMRDLAVKEGVSFIRVSPLISVEQAWPWEKLGFREAPIHNMDAEVAWVLSLEQSEDDLLRGMRKTTRYLVKKGEKIGIKIIKNIKIINFIKLYKETSKRQGFIPHQGIKEEYEIFKKDNQADLLLAEFQGKILAGVLIIYYDQQAIYHHGASIPSPIPASYLLQWEAIREAKKRGMRLYNFWGIAETERRDHPWWGLTLFKKGFGGRKVEYCHAQDLPLRKSYWLTFLIEKTRKWLNSY